MSEPYTAEGNRAWVRRTLAVKQPVFAAALTRAAAEIEEELAGDLLETPAGAGPVPGHAAERAGEMESACAVPAVRGGPVRRLPVRM